MANSRGRNVEFSVKAKDEFSKVLGDLERQQTKLSAAAKAASRRSLVGTAKEEIQATADSYKRLIADIDRYRAALDNGRKSGSLSETEMRELAETIAVTRNRSRELIATLNQKRNALNQIVGSATTGYGAFNRLASVMEMGSTAARQETAALSAASAQLKKLTADSNTAASAQTKLRSQLTSSAAAIEKQRTRTTNSKGEQQEVVMWGLKPWQLTNLGYQVNDVVSGLAMGQRPLQVFAQQAGQLAQIWPNTMVALAKGIPVLAGVGAALSPFIAAALRMREAGESMRYFQAQLASSADGGNYSAKNLADITTAITKLGISADDARKLVTSFVKEGLSASSFKQYAEMAKQLSDLTGDDIGTTGSKIATAFSGSALSVRELDKELNFLTADQLASINAMENAGQKTKALALAQDALAKKLEASKGPASDWSNAMKAMGEAWDSLVQVAQDSGLIDWMASQWQQFGRDVEKGAKDTRAQILALKRLLDGLKSPTSLNLDSLNDRIARQRELVERTAPINGSPASFANAAAKAELDALLAVHRDLVASIKDEDLLVENTTKAQEARKKIEEDIKQSVSKRLAEMQEEVRLAGLTEKERFIEKGLLELKNQIMKEGNLTEAEALGILKGQTEERRKQLGLLYDQQKSAELYQSLTTNSSSVADKIIGVESGGNANAKNPSSTATGLGQFIESTWLRMFKQHFPDRAKGMADSAILALRTNADLNRQMVELYLRENAEALKSAGVQINDATLYLAHFLGSGGATKLMKAYADNPNASAASILGQGAANANPTILGNGKSVADVYQWAQKKMAISDQEVAVTKTLNDLDADRAKKAKEFHDSQQQSLDAQKFQLENSLKEGRQAAINKAIYDAQAAAKKAGTELTKQEIAELTRLTGLEYDREHAMDNVNQLYQQRQTLLQEIRNAQTSGDASALPQLHTELDSITAKLQEAIAAARAFYEAMGGPGAEAALLKLDALGAKMNKTVSNMDTQFLPKATEINEKLADIGSNAFSAFAQAIANGEDAAKAFFNSLLQGIAEFLIEIGKAIVKQALFNALTGSSGGAGGGIAGFIGGLFGLKHDGGLVGQPSQTKMVNPSVFAGAQKYHGGGLIGVNGKKEVPIIALEDEEVLTRDDPRHVLNGGGGGGTPVNLKNVNVFSPLDVLEQSLATVEGERVFLNFITRNARKVSSAINS